MDMPLLDKQLLIVVYLLIASQLLIGLSLLFKSAWRIRTTVVAIYIMLSGIQLGVVGLHAPFYLAGLLTLTQFYFVFNILRFSRRQADHTILARKIWRSQITLSLLNLLLVNLMWLQQYENLLVGGLLITQLIVAIWLLVHTVRSLKKTKPFIAHQHFADKDLPTLSVAIPARNETSDLTECLENVLASDYPKLEVLVLDDCSQDNTSEIIRSFAHRGVRFLKGLEVGDKWLAKNYAYDQLIDNASGQYILFCGVDVRFEKQSVRLLMGEMLESGLVMMSILPHRKFVFSRNFLLQPMRYWRELAIPRLLHSTPPSLSTCWVAERAALQNIGGFEGLRRTVRPERFIARAFANKGSYKFIRSSQELAISSVKSLNAQWQTAARTRYPELQSRPENVLATTLAYLIFLLTPFVGVVYSLIVSDLIATVLCFIIVILLGLTHALVFYVTTGRRNLTAILMLPVSVVMEIFVLNYSMWAYEYSEILWKGRNICLPVLRVDSKLPKI